MVITFIAFDWKYPFGGKVGPKNQKLSVEAEVFSWFNYAEFNAGVHFSGFRLKKSFLDKFDLKSQNC